MNKSNVSLFLFCLIFCVSCIHRESDKKIITVTIEPQRYFVEQLVDWRGQNAVSIFEVSTMVAPGISPETYDPTPVQMAKLADSEAYFRIGRIGFELVWMDKIEKNNPNLKIFDNSEGIEFISPEENHDECAHGHHCHGGADPHIWSSPKQAYILTENMCNALIALNEENAGIYRENLKKLHSKIAETDSVVTTLLDKSTNKSFIIYHPALTYFANDYGLTQYSIEIEGKEPTPDQLKQLIELAREKNIKTVFIQQEFDKKNAEIIAKETNCNLVIINPLSYNWDEEMIKIAEALSHE
ncbi:MAG: zinc ABC transporter substrate-binding protein [Dysgonamonadaceae bacterium]|jgi:zinc transport system substrate-binding protein|nr:zinc ABC transporter substrate-binding protein [Dysgonamonadaceae bacterium]